MQKVLLNKAFMILIIFCVSDVFSASTSGLDVSQVRDVVQNIALATQIGQAGQDQISTVSDLGKVFGEGILNNILKLNMVNFPTQEIQSIAFGGYTFIANPFNSKANVSSNILKELWPLDFKQMAQGGTNSLFLGFFGADASGNLLKTLVNNSSNFNATGSLDHFKLYIFQSDGTLLGTEPLYIPLNKYYSASQKKFMVPVFGTDELQAQLNNSNNEQNFVFTLNGQQISASLDFSYPYIVYIENISGIDVPNRNLSMQELSSVFFSNTGNTFPQISSYYQTLDSLEIAIGNSVFSFNQNSLNQSTDIAANGICADISQYIAPLITSGMQLMFIAINQNGSIITNFEQQQAVDHYLLYIFDQSSNLVTAVYVDPAYFTPSSSFGINQAVNGVSVRVNGKTITQSQSYVYPLLINLSYGSGIQLPALSKISNTITLKQSQTLSSLTYNLVTASGSVAVSFSDTNYFNSNWLDSMNTYLDMGQTLLVNLQNSVYPQGGYEIIFTIYSLGNTPSASALLAQQAFIFPSPLSSIAVAYGTNATAQTTNASATQTLTVASSNLANSWIAIIPSKKLVPKQSLTSSLLKKYSTNYQSLAAILNASGVVVYSEPVTSYIKTQDINAQDKSVTIPGWYNSKTKQYQNNGFNLQLVQANGGSGYFFVQDISSGNINVSAFSGITGVAGLLEKSPALQALEETIVPGGTCTMALFGFDKQGNYIANILDPKTPPDHFDLYIFDGNGNNLATSPISFPASNYAGLGKYVLNPNATAPAAFYLNGLGISQAKILNYPFAVTINWNFGKNVPIPKPKPHTPTSIIPTTPDATVSVIAGQQLSYLNYGAKTQIPGVSSFSIPFPTNLSSSFFTQINQQLTTAGDFVWVNFKNNNTTITATAYNNQGTKIVDASIAPQANYNLTNQIYYIFGNNDLSVTFDPAKINNVWIKVMVTNPIPPTIPQVPDQTVTLIPQLNLTQFNYTVSGQTGIMPVTPTLSNNFLQVINANLKNSGDEVWVNLTNDGTTVTAQAYNKNKIQIGSTSMFIPKGTVTNGFYYGYSQNLSDITEIPVNSAKVNNLWIKFTVEWIYIGIEKPIENFGYVLKPTSYQTFGMGLIGGINDKLINVNSSILVNLQVKNNTITATTYPAISQTYPSVTLSPGQSIDNKFYYQEASGKKMSGTINNNQQSNLWVMFYKVANAG